MNASTHSLLYDNLSQITHCQSYEPAPSHTFDLAPLIYSMQVEDAAVILPYIKSHFICYTAAVQMVFLFTARRPCMN